MVTADEEELDGVDSTRDGEGLDLSEWDEGDGTLGAALEGLELGVELELDLELFSLCLDGSGL